MYEQIDLLITPSTDTKVQIVDREAASHNLDNFSRQKMPLEQDTKCCMQCSSGRPVAADNEEKHSHADHNQVYNCVVQLDYC